MGGKLTAHESMIEVRVYQPQTWWRATAKQLGGVVADPDTGRVPRWPSYDQNWKLIGDTVNDVADAVAARAYLLDPDYEDVVLVRVPDKGLDKLEGKIVRAWFNAGEGVTTDPWHDSWGDGRHRTFHTAKANPDVKLPVLSDHLYNARGYLERGWTDGYADSLDKLADVPWFDHSDPLNVTYRQSLQRAAFGIPPGTEPPIDQNRWTSLTRGAEVEKSTDGVPLDPAAGNEPTPIRQGALDPELQEVHRMMKLAFPHPPSAGLNRPAAASVSEESTPTTRAHQQPGRSRDTDFGL